MGKFQLQSDRDKVLEATDLVALVGEHVHLKPKGREHVGLCPFHDDRTPSLHVVTHKGSAFYTCFACGAAGNAIDFMIGYHKMAFLEALRALAERAGIPLRQVRASEAGASNVRTDLLRANAIALEYFRRSLADAERGATARAALDSRSIESSTRELFQIGAAPEGWDGFVKYINRVREHRARGGASADQGADGVPDMDAFRAAGLVRDGRDGFIDGFRNRLIFPICDELGKPIAFGARQLNPEDHPKYLNSPESALFQKGKGLYGLHLAKKTIIAQKTAIICEGYTDVMACHAAGVTNAVATLGTALTRDHARMLLRLAERVILLFDGDAAGQRAADRAVEVFFAEPIDVRICTLPDELDPDELLRQADGRERFQKALDTSEDALTHLFRGFREHHAEAAGIGGRHQRLQAFLTRLVNLGLNSMSGLRRHMVVSSLSHITGTTPIEIEAALKTIRTPVRDAEQPRDDADSIVQSLPNDHERTPTLEDRGYSQPQARRRWLAEHGVLALLVARPDLARGQLKLDDGFSLPVSEALTPEAFEDPDLSAIAQVIHPWLEECHEFSAIELLAELSTPTLKKLATELVQVGAKRLEGVRDASQRLEEAFADLEGERARRAVPAPSEKSAAVGPQGLIAAVEKTRSRGHNPAAFVRVTRPTSNLPA